MKPQLLKLCLILSLFPLIFSLVSCQNQQTQDRGITITTNQSQSQQKQRRTALVIGNASYQDNPLKNSINDAEAMANALKDVGFDVILLENADLKQIENAIDTFHHQLKAGGVGLFYYAGHGTQVDGENYLIPVNVKLDVAEDVRYEAIPVGKVLARMEDAANQMNIVILDACRNNPFARKWRSSQRGLAPIQSARGALIAFATEPGGVAADGEGENGLYTSFLLKHLKTPNLDVELMFKRVREDVVQATQNKQVPWESSSLVGDFSFNPVTVAQSSPTPVQSILPKPILNQTPFLSSKKSPAEKNTNASVDAEKASSSLNQANLIWRSQSNLTRISNLNQICFGTSTLTSVQTVFGYEKQPFTGTITIPYPKTKGCTTGDVLQGNFELSGNADNCVGTMTITWQNNNNAFIQWNINNLGSACTVSTSYWKINTYPSSL